MSLSYSRIQLYRTCPRQYEYAVIKKISRPISQGEAFGSSVHNALKRWGELEMKLGVGSRESGIGEGQMAMFDDAPSDSLPNELSLEQLLEFWHESFIVDGFESRMEADFARKNGEVLMQHFFEWWKTEQRTVSIIEKGFTVEFDGLEMKGRFDRVEEFDGGYRVIDYKTGRVRDQDAVDADLQLSLYAMAVENSLQLPCTELILLFLSEEGVIERKTYRTPGQLIDAQKQILSLKGRIDEQDYHPDPSVGKCKHCPYKNVCNAAAVK